MRWKNRVSGIGAAVLAVMALTALFPAMPGCDGGAFLGGGGTGVLTVLITDAPYPIDLIAEATITITRVEVRYGEGDDEGEEIVEPEAESDGADPSARETGDADAGVEGNGEESSWIVLAQVIEEFNLLSLRNGRTDLLASSEVPAGTYTQMRLIVTEGRVVLTDGREFVLRVPSGEQTGIKLHYDFYVVPEGSETTLLLDVDLSRAFLPIPSGKITEPGDIDHFKFSPSLAMRLINLLQAGSISGTVLDADGSVLGGVSVAAMTDGDVVTGTVTEADGSYVLAGLPTGTYTVAFSGDGLVAVETGEVAVTAGEATDGIDAQLSPSDE